MPTTNQVKSVEKELREYRKKYLRKEFSDVDESGTRIMVNSFLVDVLGYKELEEIKTEYRIRGAYADYVIQLNRKKQFIVEVKSIELDLNERHLRQSVGYAANEGIDWVILTNGRNVACYHVSFGKPISYDLVFEYDLADLKQMKKAAESIAYLTKQSVKKNELNDLWLRCSALAPESLAEHLYSEEVVRYLRRVLKKQTGTNFETDHISDALQKVINNEIKKDIKYKKK